MKKKLILTSLVLFKHTAVFIPRKKPRIETTLDALNTALERDFKPSF